jgi:hypothetical protein
LASNRSNISDEGENLPPHEGETPMEVNHVRQHRRSNEEGTPKEKWTKYIIISAISIVVVGGIFAAVQFIK